MMIPGQWEPRPSSTVAAPVAAPAAVDRRVRAIAVKRRREMATWLEVSIAVAALLGAMFIAMWASHVAPRIVMRSDQLVDRIC
jgi:hypothetical protein